MPVQKVKGGYRFGSSGKVYPTRGQAARQGRAIKASQSRSAATRKKTPVKKRAAPRKVHASRSLTAVHHSATARTLGRNVASAGVAGAGLGLLVGAKEMRRNLPIGHSATTRGLVRSVASHPIKTSMNPMARDLAHNQGIIYRASLGTNYAKSTSMKVGVASAGVALGAGLTAIAIDRHNRRKYSKPKQLRQSTIVHTGGKKKKRGHAKRGAHGQFAGWSS